MACLPVPRLNENYRARFALGECGGGHRSLICAFAIGMMIWLRGSKCRKSGNGWTRVNNPDGDSIDPSIAGVKGRKAGVNDDHDQALVGAERSRVGIRLGLRALQQAG